MAWLLVEDDNDIRTVVSMMMTFWGEQALAFPDGSSAWGWLDSIENGTYSGELPDLALMDIRMPGYNGDKVAARIRKTAALKDIPIVLMTAFTLTDTEIKQMMEESGFDRLVNKPLDMDDLRATLYRVRDERKARSTAPVLPSSETAQALPKNDAAPVLPKSDAAPALPKSDAAPVLPKSDTAQALPKSDKKPNGS